MTELVFNKDGQTITNSLLVAQKFGKAHKNVIQSIRNIIVTSDEAVGGSAENSAVLSMFIETTYLDEQGK